MKLYRNILTILSVLTVILYSCSSSDKCSTRNDYEKGYISGELVTKLGGETNCSVYVDKTNEESGLNQLRATDCFCEGFDDAISGKPSIYKGDSDKSEVKTFSIDTPSTSVVSGNSNKFETINSEVSYSGDNSLHIEKGGLSPEEIEFLDKVSKYNGDFFVQSEYNYREDSIIRYYKMNGSIKQYVMGEIIPKSGLLAASFYYDLNAYEGEIDRDNNKANISSFHYKRQYPTGAASDEIQASKIDNHIIIISIYKSGNNSTFKIVSDGKEVK